MKKLLLTGLLLTTFIATYAQTCSGLFISEYVEGTNNNKAIEIYNPTNAPITINGDYRIVRYNNGTAASIAEGLAQATVILGLHTIMPDSVWVLVIDKRNPAGVGAETPVVAALQAVADTFICPDYAVSYAVYHNGNDALSLQRNVGGIWIYADIFGEIGVDPVVSWTECAPSYDDASCGGNASTGISNPSLPYQWTKDQTLVRKPTVLGGTLVSPSPFIAPAQWDSLQKDNFSNLGIHACDCHAIGIKEIEKTSQVKLFPNPSNGSSITFVSADKKIATIVLTNTLGQIVKSIKLDSPALKTSQELNIAKGIYLSEIIFVDKSSTSEKLIVE